MFLNAIFFYQKLDHKKEIKGLQQQDGKAKGRNIL